MQDGGSAEGAGAPRHSHGRDCPRCGNGLPGTWCDHSGYGKRFVKFVQRHAEEYRTAYLAPNPRSSTALLERLRREYQTLPVRHSCSCRCPAEDRGFPPCHECLRLRAGAVKLDIGVEIGRTSLVHAPTPSTLILDLERAMAALGEDTESHELARYMTSNGYVAPAPPPEPEPEPVVEPVTATRAAARISVAAAQPVKRTCDCLAWTMMGPQFCQHLTPS